MDNASIPQYSVIGQNATTKFGVHQQLYYDYIHNYHNYYLIPHLTCHRQYLDNGSLEYLLSYFIYQIQNVDSNKQSTVDSVFQHDVNFSPVHVDRTYNRMKQKIKNSMAEVGGPL